MDHINKRKLSILVNARPLSSVLTGVARYTRSLYTAITDLKTSNVSYYSNGTVSPAMPAQAQDLVGGQLPHWLRIPAVTARHIIDCKLLNRQAKKASYDIYHETTAIPLINNNVIPTVLTVYDLSLITHPQFHPADRIRHYEKHFAKHINSTEHIITISNFVRTEIIKHMGVPEAKVTAIPLAASSFFSPQSPDKIDKIKNALGISGNYILTVGTKEPRKNLPRLLRAFDHLDLPLTFVHAGWSGWLNEELEETLSKIKNKDKIRFLGHIKDDQLAVLYSGATLMIYPSLYEGFGLPILEAMSCGCPVICSNNSSMPEIAKDSAILVNPVNSKEIANTISELAENPTLRNKLADSGIHRAEEFSWRYTAHKTLDVFSKIAN